MKNIIRVIIDGVIDKEFNIKTQLKTVSKEEINIDKDKEFLYIIKEGPVVIPSIFVKVNGAVYTTNLDVCEILNKK